MVFRTSPHKREAQKQKQKTVCCAHTATIRTSQTRQICLKITTHIHTQTLIKPGRAGVGAVALLTREPVPLALPRDMLVKPLERKTAAPLERDIRSFSIACT
jgi:hypothetical protein